MTSDSNILNVQIQEQLEQQKALASVIKQIRQPLDLQTIFQNTATEVRQLLKADRVAVFKFDIEKDWEGEFVSEDVASGWDSVIEKKVHDYCFGEQFAIHYQEGRVQAVADIYTEDLSDCHIQILGQFQVRANLIVPLLKENNNLIRAKLSLPKTQKSLNRIADLKDRIKRTLPRVSLTSETARRETLVAPLLLEVAT